jgi:inhibitor of cysteine peptidase
MDMKLKAIILSLVVVTGMSLLACSSEAAEEPAPPKAEEKPVTPTDPSSYAAATTVKFYTCTTFEEQKHVTDEFELQAGKHVTVILCSNPTTGFKWMEEAQISDTSILEQIKHEYIEPSSDKVGAAGTEKFTFHALKQGTATIYLEYSRDWEGGEKAEWTCTVTINVD